MSAGASMTHRLIIAEREQAVQRFAGFHYLTVNPSKVQHNLPHVSFPEFVRQLIANSVGAGATAVVLRLKHDVQAGSTVMDYQDNGMAMPYETHVQVFGQGVSADSARPYSNKGTGLKMAVVSNVDNCISLASTSRGPVNDSPTSDSKAAAAPDRSIVMFAPASVEGKSAGYFHWDLPGDFMGRTLQDYYAFIRDTMGADSPDYRNVLRDARDGAGYLLREDLGHAGAPFADFGALLAGFEEREVVGIGGSGMRFLMWLKHDVAAKLQDARNPKLNDSLDIRCHSTHDTFLSTVAANMFLGAELLAVLLPGTPPRPPLRASFGEATVTIRGADTPAVASVLPALGPPVCAVRVLRGPDGQEYARYIKYAGDNLPAADFGGMRGAMLVYDQDYIMTPDGFSSRPPNAMAATMESMVRECYRRTWGYVHSAEREKVTYTCLLQLLQWDEATKPAGWCKQLFAKVIVRYTRSTVSASHATIALRHIMELAGAYRFLVLVTDCNALRLDVTKQGLEEESNARLWLDMLRDSAQEVWERRLGENVKIEEESAACRAADGTSPAHSAHHVAAGSGALAVTKLLAGPTRTGALPTGAGGHGADNECAEGGELPGASSSTDVVGPCAALAVAARRSVVESVRAKRDAAAMQLQSGAGHMGAGASDGNAPASTAAAGLKVDNSLNGAGAGQAAGPVPKKPRTCAGRRKLSTVLHDFEVKFNAAVDDEEAGQGVVKGLVMKLLKRLRRLNQNVWIEKG